MATPPDELDSIMAPHMMNGVEEAQEELYFESFGDVLRRAIGYYTVCEFLIGTSNLQIKSGILYAAGSNFVTLQNPDDNSFTVCDIFSLKFATIYDSHTPPRGVLRSSPNATYPSRSSRR